MVQAGLILGLALAAMYQAARAGDTCDLNVTAGTCCPGGVAIGDQPAGSTAECCAQCQQKPECGTFTYNINEKTCYLKESVPHSQKGHCDCGHRGPLPPPGPAHQPAASACKSTWKQQPGVGCALRGGAGAGGWQVPAVNADACCTICTQNESGPGHPRCEAWTYLPYSYHANGVCIMSQTPNCQPIDSPTGEGAVGACDPSNSKCKAPSVPDPLVCEPVKRPAWPPASKTLPPGIKRPPHIVSILVDDLGFDDLRSHDIGPSSVSFSPTIAGLLKEGVLLNRHHTYMWCSPTRRSFITGRYLVHITGEQAATDTNLTPLQFTILSEKLRAANFENHFLGKGHMGWQTTDHLLVNRGFDSHMGYLGGSESYKWGRMDNSMDPSPLTGKHDMWHNDHPGTDIAPLIGYSTSFYAMQAVERIQRRNITKNFWLHVAFQAVHGGSHRSETDSCDLLPPGTGAAAQDGYRNAGYGSALHSLDHGVKNITDALKQNGMWKNTIMWLSADNGGDNPVGLASNYPLVRDQLYSNLPIAAVQAAVGRKCLSWEGGTRTFAFVAGGLLPAAVRGTINNQLMHVSDWYVTFCALSGVDATDKWTDPATGLVHDVDGQNQWPSITTGKTNPRTLPTTHKSLLVDDGKGHMYKLINGNETRADRFHPNGSVYEDPYHECLPGSFNGERCQGYEDYDDNYKTRTYGIQFDCINALGQGGGGGRMSCVVCSDDQPCLFDVLADPAETKNLAKQMPALAASMKTTLDSYLPYVPALSPQNLACYNCSFDRVAMWQGYPGPGCIRKT